MTEEETKELIKLGEKLRAFRLDKGLSQEKFSELSGLDRTYVSGLERGKRNPSFIILKRIVQILEIPFIISLRFRHGGEKITNLC